MNRIVIYKSETGFTQKYAEWIAQELQCECMALKETSAEQVSRYDEVIYGGGIMAGMVAGLGQMRKLNPKSLIVYGVGAAPYMEDAVKTLQEQNQVEKSRFFYYEGGINYEKLGVFKRSMLKMIYKSLAKKKDKTEMDRSMEQALAGSCDNSSRDAIKVLVEYCRNEEQNRG